MDEDQHYERFDMDNDYEGGEWIGGEFFFSNKKEKRRQTKDEHLYGYESDASDEDRRKRRKGAKKAADYTKPVGFVSSGVVRSTEEKPEDVDAAEHSGAGLGSRSGLGASSSGAGSMQNGTGLGYPAHSVTGGMSFKPAKEPLIMDDDEDDPSVLPTSFGKRC